ncbi:MAG: hypothetical protein WCP85_00255 [Mariniphaga sp.]
MSFESIVVIRTAGERTLTLCRKLILDQGIPEDLVFVVQEYPFSASMRRSFEIGIEMGRKWTLCIDADVLVRPGAIDYMIKVAELQAENVCEIQGHVMDKFFGGPRQAGNHLYRTLLLPEVLKHIPDEGTNIRPERYTLGLMEENGFPFVKIPYVVGIHDDEQYNFDIFRKCYVQGIKHLYLIQLFVEIWKKEAEYDQDFNVALYAIAESIKNMKPAFINSKYHLYHDLFAASGFTEKPKLDHTGFTLESIEQRILHWKISESYLAKNPTIFGLLEIEKGEKKDVSHTLLYPTFIFISKSVLWIGNKIATLARRYL